MGFELEWWALAGALGMWCIEASYLTQIWRLWRRKESDDISLFFPGLNLTGRVLAMSYSLHLGATVFAFGFLAGCVLRLVFFLQVVWYRRRPNTERSNHPGTSFELAEAR